MHASKIVKQQLTGPNLQLSTEFIAILHLGDPTALLLPQPASVKTSLYYKESFKQKHSIAVNGRGGCITCKNIFFLMNPILNEISYNPTFYMLCPGLDTSSNFYAAELGMSSIVLRLQNPNLPSKHRLQLLG